ncbi:MAG: endonuclease/exonuclease/phosphatase family protein [Bacteroidia bacterium]
MNRFSFFEKFIFPVSLVISITAFFSAIAPYVSPQKSWVLAFTGLGFPFIYTLNLFFLFFWIIKRKKLFIIPLIPFLMGLKMVPTIVQIGNSGTKEIADPKTSLKIMSFNARSFDLYNWLGNFTGKSKIRARIFEMIKKESPDVVCFQEFYTCDSGKFQTVKIMMQDIGMHYAHVVLPVNLYRIDHWGMATFSKYPLLNKSVIDFNHKGSNLCLYADMIAGNDTVRIYNCHLQSIRFGQEDYKFMNQIGYNIEEENTNGIKKILSRLKIAFAKRALQADTVAANVRLSPYPVIFCGDFNDTPTSYSYKTLSENLSDAFRESGNGLGTTYIGAFPAFRIDFILHSPQIKSYDYTTIKQKLSDHYPITCNVNLH